MKKKWRDLEVIDWLDHSRVLGGWTLQSELSRHVFKCRSVGWVIDERKKSLKIVPHFGAIDEDDMQTEGVLTIIKAAIVRRKTLKMK